MHFYEKEAELAFGLPGWYPPPGTSPNFQS